MEFETKSLREEYDYLAPDQSEIRLLLTMKGGGLCHCTLPVRCISKPVYHHTVEEIWYCLEGQGQVWRERESQGKVVDFQPGVSLTIPTGIAFQFRNTGDKPLRFIISTMPPWPGEEEGEKEAQPLKTGYWEFA